MQFSSSSSGSGGQPSASSHQTEISASKNTYQISFLQPLLPQFYTTSTTTIRHCIYSDRTINSLSLFEVYVACVMMVYKYSPFCIWITPNRGIFSFPSRFLLPLLPLLHALLLISFKIWNTKQFTFEKVDLYWLKQMGVYLHVYKISTHNNVSLFTYQNDQNECDSEKNVGEKRKKKQKKEECEWKCLHRMYFMHEIFFL